MHNSIFIYLLGKCSTKCFLQHNYKTNTRKSYNDVTNNMLVISRLLEYFLHYIYYINFPSYTNQHIRIIIVSNITLTRRRQYRKYWNIPRQFNSQCMFHQPCCKVRVPKLSCGLRTNLLLVNKTTKCQIHLLS